MTYSLNPADLEELNLGGMGLTTISDQTSFNSACREIARRSTTSPYREGEEGASFSKLLSRIEEEGDGTIKTGWGGVVIEKHEHPLVEKYLVVRAQHFLAFEKHDLKEESLFPQSGSGVLLHKRAGEDIVRVLHLTPGEQFDIVPGEEHCIIAGSDLVVFERSLDHKGMDQDLIFLFTPE